MANWREITLDKAIMHAVRNGFHDRDFVGWMQLPAETRSSLIRQIIHHNGMAHIIFRRSFARAVWGDSFDNQRQQMVIATGYPMDKSTEWPDQDQWLHYLREHMPR
jgi:hypothetical protein